MANVTELMLQSQSVNLHGISLVSRDQLTIEVNTEKIPLPDVEGETWKVKATF